MVKILLVVLMSILLVVACNEGEEKIVDDAQADAMGYDADDNISDVELNSTPQDVKQQAEGEAAANSAADMVNSMQNTIDSMADTMVDAVDNVQQGATEAFDDVSTHIKRGAEESKKDMDEALEHMKKSDESPPLEVPE